jgi:hypothetical protein
MWFEVKVLAIGLPLHNPQLSHSALSKKRMLL